MVAMKKKGWLTGVRLRFGVGGPSAERTNSESFSFDARERLAILSFEVAKAMSRLISLHRTLSEQELTRLRGPVMRSEGVQYLVSSDHLFLLRVACAELVDDLDQAVASISRLADRCRLDWPRSFDDVYAELKSGVGDFVLGFPTRDLDKKVKKMEYFVSATVSLHNEMETLAELEASERNLERWRNYSGPIPAGAKPAAVPQPDPPGADLLIKKLGEQRRLVSKLKEESLWCRSFDKIADLMSRTVVTIFGRICSIFSRIVTDLPLIAFERDGRFYFSINRRQQYYSGPIERSVVREQLARNSGPILRPEWKDLRPWPARELEPAAGTVGESGLALRYADVVVLAEEMLLSPETSDKHTRRELYQMLPNALRAAVKAKLKSSSRKMEGASGDDDEGLAAGWKDAATRILQWLGPMAHSTVSWHSDKSCERQRLEPAKAKVLLLQTLHFADRVKAEAAIVEVLVGLSCVHRCQMTGKGYTADDSD